MAKKKETRLFFEPCSVKEHVTRLIDYMTEGIYEKRHIMSMALLSAIAGESVFLLGPPGTAKSMVARRLKMVFKDAKAFEYLMSRFSTPDEIFGPVSISKLKSEDKYERIIEGYLPDAEIVFLDEIWKAGPSIQNALLTAINERIFKNGTGILNLPMKALIAASNELPAEDEGLEALWDRFLVRLVSNCISNELVFYKMLREKNHSNLEIPQGYLISNDLYKAWQLAIDDVDIPDNVCRIITEIRKSIKVEIDKEDCPSMDYYVSDRRWKKAIHLMQAAAWLNGRNSIDETDCLLLIHCLWNKSQTITRIIEIIPEAITAGIYNRIHRCRLSLEKIISHLSANMPKDRVSIIKEANEEFTVIKYFYYSIENYAGQCLFAKTDYNHIGTNKPSDGILYYDERNSAWIIHAIYTGAPFDYKVSNGKIKKVKLQKCNGGVIMDNIPYAFKRKATSTNRIQGSALLDIDEVYNDCNLVKKDCAQLKTLFTDSTNLFIGADDKTLMKRQFTKAEKDIVELELKIHNTKLLMR